MDRVQEAALALAAGEMVIVLDSADRENEGDLVLAAAHATPEKIAFLIRHTSGILCAPMTGAQADRLGLPQMVQANTERYQTAFTVPVDLVAGTTTGISAADRCRTLRALADPASRPEDFARPGHVFPLRARPGGVLERAGHTEAGVDLAVLAGLDPVLVIAELTTADSAPTDRAAAARFAAEHQLRSVTIEELVAHRLTAADDVSELAAAALPTRFGEFTARLFRTGADGAQHLALVHGDPASQERVLVRLHSECCTGDALASLRCDCGDQLATAMEQIAHAGAGVLIYQLGHEGRGIGLAAKLQAYALQDQGLDTVEANLRLGLPVDARDFGAAPRVLRALGVTRVSLLTNNPAKLTAMRRGGLPDVQRRPLLVPRRPENAGYVTTKRHRMGHLPSSTQQTALTEAR